ncbi:TraU family protein [Brevundimonas nasdae]|uniref:TraU family protein n=1 Tax=Brevundimonas nasdae TaxID=172043 RepID=A0ABX8TEP9_9CAUL|nr:TraU family protein [Brevundimonas nasdae]QYC09667.1 TraU family protein [Brevundimonas nasdae]QYC12457.1 TraU family protein [Brevundimonas nasdae]
MAREGEVLLGEDIGQGDDDVAYESGKTIPIKGEDYGFLVWRKRNCCVTVIP